MCPAAAKSPSSLATRPTSRSPDTRTKGGQSCDAAERASLSQSEAATAAPLQPTKATAHGSRFRSCPRASVRGATSALPVAGSSGRITR